MADPQREPPAHRGLIDARWLQTVELPAARAFSRGYDRVTVDGLLDDCADTIDELTWQLEHAHQEAVELRRQACARALRRRSRARARRSTDTLRRRRRMGPKGG